MFREMIGEWGNYEDWEIAEVIINLENELANARQEQKRRSKNKKKYYTRDERKSQILHILRDGKTRTTSQIAALLEVSPSGHLRNIICELYRDGDICGYALNTVASHPIFYWHIQKTVPIPFSDYDGVGSAEGSSQESPCGV